MYGLRELLDNVHESLMKKIDVIKSYVNSTESHVIKANALTYFIVYYGKFVTIVSDNYNKVYNSNIVVKSIVDHSQYFVMYAYSYVIGQKIEPMTSYWISSSVLSKRDKNRYIGEEYTLVEYYEFIKNPDQIVDGGRSNCETSYNEICDAIDSIVLNSQSYIEGMAKMKVGSHYVYRIFDNNNGLFKDFILPIIPSKAKFLSIEYTHPLMKKNIVVDLDRSLYLVDNHILSPTFIKLYLEHQSELYHFDMDYVLKIIDNDINSIEIGFDKSIVLTKDGYKIV